jgi:hypothetical protein
MRLDFDRALDEHGPFRSVNASALAKTQVTALPGEVQNQSILTGGCLCAAVRWECEAQPMSGGHCQCRDCQKNTGTGHSSHFGVPAGALRVAASPTLPAHKSRHMLMQVTAFTHLRQSPEKR